MNQAYAAFESMCADIGDDLFRLDYCVNKILELSAVTTDMRERIFEFAQSGAV